MIPLCMHSCINLIVLVCCLAVGCFSLRRNNEEKFQLRFMRGFEVVMAVIITTSVLCYANASYEDGHSMFL
jgi:hypothetical protein